ncbi:NTP transferase domain-containing protein [Conexibacter sp. W3-3-2]|uniref:sugar phosphate nucleotidyltransferase n=1 Tax=Conexibacter sp. W3-3-2 TaxID=2675227 RepID=UPI0012B81607|nr:NDP-sugar synthase [Conexibacter sp. W3-3-2]MTD44129.1 NTP transferase domain-containing protein [Conexibacter sp. W3-3-2]
MQAVILVGGEGTRLRPLTSGIPKPIVTFVDRPFMAYMLQWLRGHGVDDVVMACGFLPDAVQAALGDGSDYGVRLTYLQEPEPRGTAGALKFAQDHLQERFLMLNGDVLTDVDVSAQIAQHERTGATATLGLVPVTDPSAYGLVLTQDDGAVTGFLEKPGPDQLGGIDEYLISAGIYVLERSVLDMIEPDQNVSIETQVWPALVGNGLYASADRSAYWLDIGTPQRYLQGTSDILAGNVTTQVLDRLTDGLAVAGDVADGATVIAPAIVEAGAAVAAGATVGPGAVIGAGASVAAGATVERSIVLDGASVAADAVVRDAIVAPRATVGERTVVEQEAVLGEGTTVGADNVLSRGVKIFPGATVGDGAVRF